MKHQNRKSVPDLSAACKIHKASHKKFWRNLAIFITLWIVALSLTVGAGVWYLLTHVI